MKTGPTRRVLLIAYHYPPCVGSSGLLRTLKFSRFLAEFGWRPVVLTLRPAAYPAIDMSQMDSIPPEVPIVRARAFDAKKSLSFHGFYPDILAIPDRWGNWLFAGVLAGLRAVRKHGIEVIFSTFPISTAILIGLVLHLLTGKPWVVDFRDSMTEDNYPAEKWRWRVWRWLERQAVRRAARLLFTAPSTLKMYLARYPELPAAKCVLIPNGYDEEDFCGLPIARSSPNKQTRLVHLGLVYPVERDPKPFFRALSELHKNAKLDSIKLRVEFRASGYESEYAKIIRDEGIESLVHLLPPLLYREALQESANADGLLLFQAACCDHQIPAKLFEYLRLGKPILALTSHQGDTASLLSKSGGATVVDLADWRAIYDAFPKFLTAVAAGNHPQPVSSVVESYGRRAQAGQLALALDQVVGAQPNRP
jgi:glycosyltransferase involved in cell wall biosynthesis